METIGNMKKSAAFHVDRDGPIFVGPMGKTGRCTNLLPTRRERASNHGGRDKRSITEMKKTRERVGVLHATLPAKKGSSAFVEALAECNSTSTSYCARTQIVYCLLAIIPDFFAFSVPVQNLCLTTRRTTTTTTNHRCQTSYYSRRWHRFQRPWPCRRWRHDRRPPQRSSTTTVRPPERCCCCWQMD